VPHQLGDQDQVGAAPDERSGEGVPENVRGRLVLLAGRVGERGHDVAGATS
jgi:hypothetical protein